MKNFSVKYYGKNFVTAPYDRYDDPRMVEWFDPKTNQYELLNDKYFFTGTSDVYLDRIKKDGYPKGRYITRNHGIAWYEAVYKCIGDQSEAAFKKKPVGGSPILLVIKRSSIDETELLIDQGYPEQDYGQSYIYQKPISPRDIVDILTLDLDKMKVTPGGYVRNPNYPERTKYYKPIQ